MKDGKANLKQRNRTVKSGKTVITVVPKSWTKPEILDKWRTLRPYHTETKSLDLREGGMWLYAMVSPENKKHWC
ncbi:SRPBCC domain-containing protein [Sinomicrobium sp. M5D2P17]